MQGGVGPAVEPAMDSRTTAVPSLLPARVWLVALVAVALAYLVTMESGPVLADGARFLHEAFHDGRHFLGFPCH